jgi:hypothetical protein
MRLPYKLFPRFKDDLAADHGHDGFLRNVTGELL